MFAVRKSCNNNGFTLVEMAIVLVIIGFLIGVGIAMIGPLTTMSKVRETRDITTAAADSISSWAAGNNRIPPFAPTAPDTARFSQIVQKSQDSWSGPLIYAYDGNLAPTGAAAATKDTICGRRSTLITLTNTATGSTVSNIAYIIVSQAENATTDTSIAGVPLTSGPITAATTITTNSDIDILRWVTLDELRSKIGCQGPQLKIVNNELPPGNNLTPYTASIYAEGGVPYLASGKYSWCIQNITGTVPTNITYKDTSGTTNIPFSTNCKGGLIESGWTRSDSIIVATTPTVVIGDDSKYYTCILSHTATAINRPISGTSWSTYWIQTGNSGPLWISGTSYTTPPSTNYFTVFVRDTSDTSTPPSTSCHR